MLPIFIVIKTSLPTFIKIILITEKKHKFRKKFRFEDQKKTKRKEDKWFTSNFNPNFLRQSFIYSTYCLFCGFNFLIEKRECLGYPKVLMFGSFQNSARCSTGL